jgi:prevent-host-death family protein
MNISTADAKAKFSELLKRVEAGEEVQVTRHGKVVAKIVPPDDARGAKGLIGAMKGEIWIADDFDELGPEWDEYTK